jgi:hypothetical protein
MNIVYNTGVVQLYEKNNLKTTKANGFKYFNRVRRGDLNYQVWSDGLYQYSGQNILSGDIYNLTNVISGDYIIDENENILFNNSFGLNDYVKIDLSSPNFYSGLYIDNFNLFNSALTLSDDKYYLNWPSNSQIFLNGQKLISGIDREIGRSADYGVSGNIIYFKNTGVFYNLSESVLSAIVESGICDDVSQSNLIGAKSKFLTNSARSYRNGVRLDNQYDYIELGNFDTNLGTGIFDIKQNIIYNGNGGFN